MCVDMCGSNKILNPFRKKISVAFALLLLQKLEKIPPGYFEILRSPHFAISLKSNYSFFKYKNELSIKKRLEELYSNKPLENFGSFKYALKEIKVINAEQLFYFENFILNDKK